MCICRLSYRLSQYYAMHLKMEINVPLLHTRLVPISSAHARLSAMAPTGRCARLAQMDSG